MTAAMGLNTSLIEDKSRQLPRKTSTKDSDASPAFAVVQTLVALLAKCGLPAMKQTSSLVENLKGYITESLLFFLLSNLV
jgi:hypothetical protein